VVAWLRTAWGRGCDRVRTGTAVSDLIDRLQAERQELALVRGGGSVAGLVTVTDGMEAITGEIRDPLDGDAGD